MSDPLNPLCVECGAKPAEYGKPLCTECKEAAEVVTDRDCGDGQPQEVS